MVFIVLGPVALLVLWMFTGGPEAGEDAYCNRMERNIGAFEACMTEPGCTYTAEDRSLHALRLRNFERECEQ
jgi:hypothetical protein